MIIQHLIDTYISPDIVTLPFVERYGGVVQVLPKKYHNEGSKPVEKKYPVSCNVNQADCEDDAFYQELIPDEGKASVFYWEVSQGMQYVGNASQGNKDSNSRYFKNLAKNQIISKGRARIIGWLNLAKLGKKVCNGAFGPSSNLWPVINKRIKINSGEFQGGKVEFKVTGEVVKDLNIFSKYTYPLYLNYYLYPFDYFALDVEITLEACMSNVTAFTPETEINCIDYSRS